MIHRAQSVKRRIRRRERASGLKGPLAEALQGEPTIGVRMVGPGTARRDIEEIIDCIRDELPTETGAVLSSL
jgi:hypothetical protein